METAPTADSERADSVRGTNGRPDTGLSAACLPESFFRHVLAHNPFTFNRSSADGGEGPDVVHLQSEVFTRLTELAAEAVRLRRGLGVLLTGESGAGKSHLLGRLARWAAVGGRACFVVVRGLQTDPELLPAAVMRSAGAALAGRAGSRPVRTPLYRLAHGAARVALADNQERYSWERVGKAFARLADRLAPAARRVPEGRAMFDLLYRFFRSGARAAEGKEDGATAEVILRWLTGGMLDATEARRLHLPPGRHRDDAVTLTDPEWARQGLTALAVMATAAGRPFILAIDQAEELDSNRFASLARFLNGILDHAPGILAITAADNGTVQRWRDRGDVPAAAWNRLGHFTLEPARLRDKDVIALVRRRLDEALSPFKDVEFLYRLRADAPLFPLHLELNTCGAWAREALEAARFAWEAEQEVLRREGGSAWLAAWAERMAPRSDKSAADESDAESSLTREQMQAAIALRARSAAPAAEPSKLAAGAAGAVPSHVPDSAAEELAVENELVSSLTREQLRSEFTGLTPIGADDPDTLTRRELIGYETASIPDPPSAEAIRQGLRPTSSGDFELALSDEQMREGSARVETGGESPVDEPPPAAAEAVAFATAEAQPPADQSQPTIAEEASPEPAPPAPTAVDPPQPEAAALAEPPTLPDPNAVRPRRAPEAGASASPATGPVPSPETEARVFAPSGRKTVLTPRAWPPSAPAPTPREELIDQAITATVAGYLASRGPRHELPPDAEQVAELILNVLQQCLAAHTGYGILQAERVPTWKAAPTACDFIVKQQADGDATLRTGVLVLTGDRATAIAGYLRRLTTEAQPFDRLFLITEERVGLPLGPRGLEYLQELQQRSSVQLHTLEITGAEHAELSAFRAAVRQARGGTLAVDGTRITEAEAIASHHRQQRYLASAFLASILFDAPPTELIRSAPALAP